MAKTLEELLEGLTDKVDEQHKDIDRRLDNIEKVMIVQELNLKVHMKRSDNLEDLVNAIQEKELKPLHKHVSQVEGVFKFLGLLALILTIATGISKLLGLI
jgi:hypothetical protein